MDKIRYDKEIRSFAIVSSPINKTKISSKAGKTINKVNNNSGKYKFIVLSRDLLTKKPLKKIVSANSNLDAITKVRNSYMKPGNKIKPIMVKAFKSPDEDRQAMNYAQILSK